MIENQRLANLKHQELQFRQLEAAKNLLKKQVENQKLLQIKWMAESTNKEGDKSSPLEMKILKNGNTDPDDERETDAYSLKQSSNIQPDRANIKEDLQINITIQEKMKSQLKMAEIVLPENKEEQNGMIVEEMNAIQHEIVEETFYLAEVFEPVEEPDSELAQIKHLNEDTSQKESSLVNIPYEVTSAVELVMSHFQQQNVSFGSRLSLF